MYTTIKTQITTTVSYIVYAKYVCRKIIYNIYKHDTADIAKMKQCHHKIIV